MAPLPEILNLLLARIAVALVGAALAALLLLNPRLVVPLLVGLAIGVGFVLILVWRDGLRTDAAQLKGAVRREGRRGPLTVFRAVSLATVAIATVVVSFASLHYTSQPAVRTEQVPYRASVIYRDDRFEAHEEYRLAKKILRSKGILRRPKGTQRSVLVVPAAWTETQIGADIIFAHSKVVRVSPVPLWPMRTTLSLPITTLDFPHIRFEPDATSTVQLDAPSSVVEATSPSSDSVPASAGRVRRVITLNSAGQFESVGRVEVVAYSRIGRNPIVRPLLELSFWSPIKWILATLIIASSALFSDALKDWLRAVLRFAKPGTGSGGEK